MSLFEFYKYASPLTLWYLWHPTKCETTHLKADCTLFHTTWRKHVAWPMNYSETLDAIFRLNFFFVLKAYLFNLSYFFQSHCDYQSKVIHSLHCVSHYRSLICWSDVVWQTKGENLGLTCDVRLKGSNQTNVVTLNDCLNSYIIICVVKEINMLQRVLQLE